MFARLVGLVILVLLAALLASWLGAQPGMLAFEWLGWQVEMRTSLAVALLVVLALLLLFVDRLFRGLLGLPACSCRSASNSAAGQNPGMTASASCALPIRARRRSDVSLPALSSSASR